ncbi:MAG: hypothetical protein J0I19_16750, partial [Alphaproteobacteria bacterium]|nr:hypothetical protein [Alphaproteobacteria bacterium]
MPKLFMQIIIALALLIGIASVVFFTANAVTVTTTKAGYEACLDGAEEDHQPLSTCFKRETLWDRGLSDPVAFYTLWLTFFTLALAVGGLFQSFLIGQQIRLSRQEFVATQRPKIRVRKVSIDKPVEGEFITVRFDAFNVGSTRARMDKVEITVRIAEMPIAYIFYANGKREITETGEVKLNARGVMPGDTLQVSGKVVTFAREWAFKGN